MKILHSADWHVDGRGNYLGQTEKTMECLKWMLSQASLLTPTLILISGDLFHKAKVWIERGGEDITEVRGIVNDLSKIAPVIIIKGTPNHDGTAHYSLLTELLSDNDNVTIIMEPALKTIQTTEGPINIVGIPGIKYGSYRAGTSGLSKTEENQQLSDSIMDIIEELRMKCQSPVILMAHYSVTGANTESGQTTIFADVEVVLDRKRLQELDFDLVALGHIHRPQEVAPLMFYSGSINANNFNDEGQARGFYLHDLTTRVSSFIETPYQHYLTLRFNNDDIESFNDGVSIVDDSVKDHVVRVFYEAKPETMNMFNPALMEKVLLSSGATWVQEITCDRRLETENASTMGTDPILNIEEHFKDHPEVNELVALAKPVLEQQTSDNNQIKGRMTPRSLEVKHYRNYENEFVDFEMIDFTVVIGANGSGKSSLFMDSIIDCLFEETRENDIRGWISNRSDVKSGSITFIFSIGDILYRVVRTRTKKGHATLSLCEYIEEEWADRSGAKMKDTQDEIIHLIGDALTLKSCGIIMQDQYGLFLEADRTERMQVMSRLLGLNIYEEAKAAFAEMALEEKRELSGNQKLKENAVHEISEEVGLQKEINECKSMILQYEPQKQALVELRKTVEIHQELLKVQQREQTSVNEKTKHRDQLDAIIKELQKDITALELKIKREPLIIDNVANAQVLEQKIKNLERVRDEKKLQEAAYQKNERELEEHSKSVRDLKERHQKVMELLSRKDAIKAGANRYQIGQKALKEALEKSVVFQQTTEQLQSKQSELALQQQQFDNDYAKLCDDYKKARATVQQIQSTGCKGEMTCPFLKQAHTYDLPQMVTDNTAWKERSRLDLVDKEKKTQELVMAIKNLNFDLSIIDSVNKQIKDNEADYQMHQQLAIQSEQADELYQRIRSEQAKLIRIQGELDSKKKKNDTLTESLLELKSLQDAYQLLIPFMKEEKELDGNRQVHAMKQTTLMERKNEVSALNTAILMHQETLDKRQHQILAMKITKTSNEVDVEQQEVEKHLKDWYYKEAKLNLRQERLEKMEQALIKYDDIIKESGKKLAYLIHLKDACSYTGIPHIIVSDEITQIEQKANMILSQMSNGQMQLKFVTEKLTKNGGVREIPVLDVTIHDEGVGILPYSSKSGGERVKASLATALALAEIKASKCGLQLGFLFVDEPPYLDDKGAEAYCDALETIRSRYGGLKVIAITHDQSMQSRFIQNIFIEKTEDGSRIVN